MDLTWSLDDIARTSEDAAVRQRFARRNRVYLVVLLICFTVVSIVEVASHNRHTTPFDNLLGAFNLALTSFSLFFLRYAYGNRDATAGFMWRAGAWLRAHISAVALGFVAIQYAIGLTYTRHGDDWSGWAMTFPMMVIGFRMLIAELVLLHAFLLGGGILMAASSPIGRTQGLPFYFAMVAINAMALAVELWLSHRMRKSVSSEWRSRRAQAREQIRMRDELRYARELQLSMLPDCAPRLDWIDICAISIPATEVGGDYYDYFVEPDSVALVCGDVAGHGMSSGLVLSAIRSGFTLLRESLGDPSSVLARLHDMVARTTRRRMLVTAAVVLVDRTRGIATIASAGHPPVLVRHSDGSVDTLNLFAPPLGVRLPVDIPQKTIAVSPGDVFVLHSDGIYETTSPSGESYGIDRLENLLRAREHGTAEEIRDAILRDVAEFRGGREQDDDVTIVVARVL